jgi:ketosteroid isomerase-like protein
MKKIILLNLLLIIFWNCKNHLESQNAKALENEKLIKDYFEHFNKHDWEKMASLYTETSEFKDPTLGQGIVKLSRSEIIKKYSELQKMIPDVKDTIVQIYPSRDKHIIVEFISSGTTPDQKKFTLPICTVFTIENGFITKDFSYFDNFEEGK